MMHSVESLEKELARLRCRPRAEAATPVLGEFTVDVAGEPAPYVDRVRAVLSAAVALGATSEFEGQDLPVESIPGWFVAVSSGQGGSPPEFSRNGRDLYVSYTGWVPWDIQDWLYRFAPEEESRGWEWWDATLVGLSRVRVWVDCWGESFFGCEELRWLLCTAGAVHVDGPAVRDVEDWVAETKDGPADAT